jgi:hypothetical protein
MDKTGANSKTGKRIENLELKIFNLQLSIAAWASRDDKAEASRR